MNDHKRRNTILITALIAFGVLFGVWWWNTTQASPFFRSDMLKMYPQDESLPALYDESERLPFMDQEPPFHGNSGSAAPLPQELQEQPNLSGSTELDDLEADLEGTQVIEVQVESL